MTIAKLWILNMVLLAFQPWAQPVNAKPLQIETYCGIEKPALGDVQGPRLPGQMLYPTWPPLGITC